MDIDVRSVTSSDRTTIEQLYENYLHELHPERSQLPIEPNEWISNIYTQALVGQRCLWLAFVEDNAIGFVDFKIMPCFPGSSQKYAMVFDFYIVPPQRRCGHGTQLAHFVFEEIRHQNASSIELNVLPDNRKARDFWQSLGFGLRHYTYEMLVSDIKSVKQP
ncbi:MAG: GNAT family N-acetyltransferase [Hydrococcus sp. RU_2_2]|nr:GNAT family N-acetyltransferase [Hydrococcus sp. RU_2_2]NJP20070.1 GNAT family N-acetyltransferase [Hydrococcus sp. CRU_1_1]NJQ97172.1 GNAT family N-acetyltransferase [Hydrococcus sp. CSU_1_8]